MKMLTAFAAPQWLRAAQKSGFRLLVRQQLVRQQNVDLADFNSLGGARQAERVEMR
jgi:hypothetical protein